MFLVAIQIIRVLQAAVLQKANPLNIKGEKKSSRISSQEIRKLSSSFVQLRKGGLAVMSTRPAWKSIV